MSARSPSGQESSISCSVVACFGFYLAGPFAFIEFHAGMFLFYFNSEVFRSGPPIELHLSRLRRADEGEDLLELPGESFICSGVRSGRYNRNNLFAIRKHGRTEHRNFVAQEGCRRQVESTDSTPGYSIED